ncbi:MAG: DUF1858 domain-containing protein [Lachnospiraceae bacterium]|nr:DUF1858 domain-containing protein [Lachnospiraceae bacterium]MCR5211611.1 DUF1858 domain-containing protein [Lachnospiraceae bacterium]
MDLTSEKKEESGKDLFVSKDTLIGELLQIDSGVGYILMGIGMHCFGCPASQMETIEEAAMVHGVDPDALCDEINDYIATHKKTQETAEA